MRIEHWWYTLPLRLKSIFRRTQADRELDEELQFHLDHLIGQGIAKGLAPDEARDAAMRTMGGLQQRKEEARDARGVNWLTDFVEDGRFAIRSLGRAPGLTMFVALSLAIGIGMTAAGFSMLDGLIFRPYPVPRPDEVVTLVSTTRDAGYEMFSHREYLDLRRLTRSYDGLIASGAIGPVGFSADPATTPRVKAGIVVSGDYFDVLGVRPVLGRGFRPDEDAVPGRDAVAVLSWDFWKHQFAADPSVVGRTIRLNGKDHTVIGVLPGSFPGLSTFQRPDVYVPLAMARSYSTDPTRDFFEDRDARTLIVRGRLKREVSIDKARSELVVLARTFERDHPETSRGRGATVRTAVEMRTRPDFAEWKFGVVFAVLSLGVLLVSCTNVAGLLLSRAGARTREIAVRLALGAGRSRVIRLLLTESLLLALLGGAAGILIGHAIVEYFGAFHIPTTLPVTVPFRIDARVLGISLALSVLSALLAGLAPALQSTRTDLVKALKSGEAERAGGRRLWARNALVVAQVATSMMLIAATFLMLRGFKSALGLDTEFARNAQDHVLLASFDPRLVQYDAARTARFYEQLVERVRQAPGVASAGYTLNPPLGLGDFEAVAFAPEGYDMPRDRETFTATMDRVDPGYFATMGIPILRGRGFLATDTPEAPRVVVVNEHFAKHYWPAGDALGKRLWIGGRAGTPAEIVGIAKTARYRDAGERPMGFVYLPLSQNPAARLVLLVRSEGDPMRALAPLTESVRALDANMPVLETRSYRELYRYSAVEGPGIAVQLAGAMAVTALLLAIAGLYGLIAYNVNRRTREIGIRMAVGAQPIDVLRLVMGKGLLLVGTGTAIGVAMGFALERFLNAMLFDSGGVAIEVYALVVPGMVLVTMLAAWVPARRAARIDPTLALRYE